MSEPVNDNQIDPKLILAGADRLGVVMQALLVAGDPHPASVMVAATRLFMVGAQAAGLPADANTFKGFLEGFPGVIPGQEPQPSIIVPSEAEIAALN
jgi:hypothetical protein